MGRRAASEEQIHRPHRSRKSFFPSRRRLIYFSNFPLAAAAMEIRFTVVGLDSLQFQKFITEANEKTDKVEIIRK